MKGMRRFIRANVVQTLRRFRSLFTVFGGGIVILLVSATIAGTVISGNAVRLDEASELSALELLSVSPAGEPRQLTKGALAEISSLPGVTRVIGAASVGVAMEPQAGASAGLSDAFAGVYWLMPRFPWSQPPVTVGVDGRGEGELQPGEVLMPSTSMGVDMRPLVGATLDVEYTRRVDAGQGVPEVMQLTVVGLYDASSPRMAGEGAAYVGQEDFVRVFGALLGAPSGALPSDVVFPRAWVKARTVGEANSVAREVGAAGFYVQSGGGVESLAPALVLLRQANNVGALLLGLFGLGIGAALSGTWAQLRRWDVGLLASMGWSRLLILRAYAAELGLVGLVVGLSAALVAWGVSAAMSLMLRGHTLLGLQLGEGLALLPWPWLVGVAAAVPVVFMVGALPRLWLLIGTRPDDALRRPE